MCYESSQLAYRIYRDAKRLGASEEELDELRKRWHDLENDRPQFYHVSGFNHPDLLGFTRKNQSLELETFYWGLIPEWVANEEQASRLWNQTLNARGESIFSKPAFRDAANRERIVLPLTGFFEHHHRKGKTYPYFIAAEEAEDLLVGGLASEWVNPASGELIRTATIVTVEGNALMTRIHNNPKLDGPRMPFILEDDEAEQWMCGTKSEAEALLVKQRNISLTAHTVRRLRGKEYPGNCAQAQEAFEYAELIEPPGLF